MPISKEFLQSFSKFISNYKLNGGSSVLGWGKEQNHSDICSYLDEILALITSNQESIHDASVIEYLTIPINLSANSNRYLLDCWNKCLSEYNSTSKIYSPISTMSSGSPIHIQISPEGTSSERMMRDLRTALDSTQKVQEFSRKAYSSEIELLKKQLEELQHENTQLISENRHLKEQVRNDQMFRSLQPQISSAQKQLASFAELLNTLYEITGEKANTSVSNPLSIIPSVIKHDVVPSRVEPLSSISSSRDNREALGKDTVSIPLVPEKKGEVSEPKAQPIGSLKKPPIPPIPSSTDNREALGKDTASIPLVPEIKGEISEPKALPIGSHKKPLTPPLTNQPPESKPLLSGEGFFKELSSAIAKREAKTNKEKQSAPSLTSTNVEKKNM